MLTLRSIVVLSMSYCTVIFFFPLILNVNVMQRCLLALSVNVYQRKPYQALGVPRVALLVRSIQVEEESMDVVYAIEKMGSRSGAPSEKVEVADSGML